MANAEFRVCNATQNIVGVAIGYRDKVSWHSEGWWRINPTHCETLLEAPLESRYYYLHVEDIGNDGEWRGNIPMCVKDEEFLINGTENCYVRGYQKAIFQEFDTGAQTRWTVQLTDGKMIKEVKSKRSLEESAR